MENLTPLLDMGFTVYQLEGAYASGCRTVGEAVDFLMGESQPLSSTSSTANRLTLGPHLSPRGSVFNPTEHFPVAMPTEPLNLNHAPESASHEDSPSRMEDEEFQSRQLEARKVADSLKRERLERQRERERVLAEIKADRESRRSGYHRQPQGNEIAPQQSSPTPSSSRGIRLKIYLGDSTLPPIVLTLSATATYADLLNSLQESVLSEERLRMLENASSNEHLTSRHVTDPCFQLVANLWPRIVLPQCHSLSEDSANSSILQTRLTALNITDGVTLRVNHVNCQFQPRPSPRPPSPVDVVVPTEPPVTAGVESFPTFPPGGQQLVPRPSGVLPRSALTPQENARRAALQREAQRAVVPTDETPILPSSPHTWLSPLSLSQQCMHRLADMITRYARLSSAAQFDPHAPTGTSNSFCPAEYRVLHRLSRFPWPPHIADELIQKLCNALAFNVRTASILNNCIDRLNLTGYTLVTSDLLRCLTERWLGLTQLHLGGLQTGQVSVEAISLLRNLRNLKFLNLNGLTAVCDRNISDIISLPHLTILRVAHTHLTDHGWIQHLAAYPDQERPLLDLNCAGLSDSLTNAGLVAIISLFPKLRSLNAAMSSITSDLSSVQCSPPCWLSHLNLNDIQSMEIIPTFLLPARTATQSGLLELSIARCTRLNLSALLDQLEGHPITHIHGLETLPGLNVDILMRYCNSNFPLVELDLHSINQAWMTESPVVLSNLLSTLSPTNLARLSLPQRRIGQGDDHMLADALSLLSRFPMLDTLNLGSQVQTQAELLAVRSVLGSIRRLKRLIVINLPSSFEQSLGDSCPPTCTIHVQRFL